MISCFTESNTIGNIRFMNTIELVRKVSTQISLEETLIMLISLSAIKMASQFFKDILKKRQSREMKDMIS